MFARKSVLLTKLLKPGPQPYTTALKRHFRPLPFPKKLRNFAALGRYHSQIGTYLLFFPCAWGVALASPSPLSLLALQKYLLYFWGAFHLRSAGCGINDIFDRDIDPLIARTKTRPLASKSLTVNEAIAFTAAHCLAGLPVLFCIPQTAALLSLAVFPIAMLYPLAKRYTHYPQLVLGCVMNFGLFVGFSSVTGSLAGLYVVLPWWVAGVFWTMIYDTIYAYQDRKDDVKVGVKGMAIILGGDGIFWLKRMNVFMHLN
jgi:4-hydroxybenzoate polyprenyl transferase